MQLLYQILEQLMLRHRQHTLLVQMMETMLYIQPRSLQAVRLQQRTQKLKQLRSNAVTHHYDIICLNKATSWN